MRKKLTLLFTLLCASVMGWAAIDWSGYSYIACDAGGSYGNQFKVAPAEGQNVASIQNFQDQGWGIYTSFGSTINSVSGVSSYKIEGGGVCLHCSSFTQQETEVTVVCASQSYTFTVYNGKVGGSTPDSEDPVDTEPATIDWNNVNWIEGSNDKLKMVVSPAGPDIVNVQGHGNPSQNTIYVTYTGAPNFGDCSLGESAYEAQGTGVFFYTSNFWKQETEFTQVFNGTTYTYHVYNADGEPENLTGWNIAKGKTAHAGADDASAYKAVDGVKTGDAHRWGSSGAQHYAEVGDAAQDWWYVDLGGFYEISQIKILFETACPNDYDILTSPNGTSWVVARTLTVAPKTGTTDDQYNIYDFSPAKVARYIKVFAREGYEHLLYGFSMWEFEAYGDRAEGYDVNPPTLTSAVVSGSPTANEIKIAVSATDTEDSEVSLFHVIEPTLGYDRNMTAVEGKLTFSGLEENTAYHFTITALDAIGNQSSEIIVNASTTVDPSVPAVVAPIPPVREADDVRRVYSDSYTDVLNHDFVKHMWEGVVEQSKVKDGNNYLIYDMSAGGTVVIWGSNNDGGDAIIAKEAYRAPGQMGLDVSGMEMMHVDIWSNVALSNISVCINDPTLRNISHNGEGWQSYDIELTSPVDNVDLTNLRWMKFKGIEQSGRQKIAIDNVYFWKTSTGLKSVSAIPNNAEYGSASVVVTETGLAPEGGTVADGTEVTFSAVANDGYLFTGWSNGETRATFDVDVNAAMNLTANFRALGTVYCNTELTANDHTIYLTVKRSDVNEYTMIVRSTEEMTNFGGTVFYRPENILVKDVRNEGVLSDGNHTLTVTMSADGEPYFGTPLYVVFAGVGEVTFNQLLNVRPEYAVACDDAVSVTSIALSQNSANLLVTKTLTLTPTFAPVYATDRALTWETSNASVATVENGVVTAVAEGNATITAKLTNDNSIYATCNVRVVASLTEATWHGYVVATTPTEGNILVTYSVTRDVNQHLTFSLTTDKDLLGFVAFINIAGVAHELTGYGAEHTATFTTTDKYEDNIPLNCTWDLRGANYGENFNFTYMVGSNEAQKTLSLSETQDNISALTPLDGQEVTMAIVNRSFAAGNLYTLVLPFDVDAAMRAEKLPGQLTRLNNTIVKGNDDLRINFVDAEAVEAGVPYLYSPSADVTNPVFTGVTVHKDLHPTEPADGYAKYYGIYAPTTGEWLKTQADAYVLGSDRYLYTTSSLSDAQTMNALRGYFVLNFPTGGGANGAPRARVVFNSHETETTTDVSYVQDDNVPCTKVIRDGQLLIMKGNRTYNAQGQLIK